MPQSKTQTGKLNKKSKPIGMLYPDPDLISKDTQRLKGLVEDLSIKWRAKKKKKTGVVTFISDKIDFNDNKD